MVLRDSGRHRIEAPHDDGFATVLAIAIVAALVSLLMIMSSAGAWLLARSHAATIADLAALAAAMHGSCGAAHDVAASNAATVLNCVWQGSDVVVVISTPIEGTAVALPVQRAEASARAGY